MTDTSDNFIIHGRRGEGRAVFAISASLHADDTAAANETREDLEADQRALCPHFARFALIIHQGREGKKSKSEFVFFARQPSTYMNAHYLPPTWRPTTATEASRACDVDLSPLVIDPDPRTCMTFTSSFCYLGSLLDTTLSDLSDVTNRVRKGSQAFGMLRKSFFCSPHFSRTTKRIVFDSLVTNICLFGCESWSVTAEIERRLRSMQTQCCKQMLGITTDEMMSNRVSAAEMRDRLGMEDIIQRMRCLQLNWLGNTRNMPLSRLPRQLLVSWLPSPRLRNCPQTAPKVSLRLYDRSGSTRNTGLHLQRILGSGTDTSSRP